MTGGSRQFQRAVRLTGWSARSCWGFDPVLECYWAALEPDGAADRVAVRIGPEHLLTTLGGLARAVALRAEVGDTEAYLALTA